MVTVARVTTEQEFQEVVTWWNLKREREIFHRWGYMGRTLDSMFPLPQEFRTRREETEAALRPYWERGEIWTCRGRDGAIHSAACFELRPQVAVHFYILIDFDYRFSLKPEEIPPGGLPAGPEELQWYGAPKASLRERAGLGDEYEAAIREVVYGNLLRRGCEKVEFREVYGSFPFPRAILSITPLGFDKWIRKQRYRVVVDLRVLMAKRAGQAGVQDRLRRAEAL